MKDCVFCKIVVGEVPSYKVWENQDFLAFLSIYPNTKGVTVVIPKKHYESYVFNLENKVLSELMIATKKVAKLLDATIEGVGRTALVFEGYGVDHVHAKLFPMHGTTDMTEWHKIESKVDKYFEKYEGYISSHDYKKEDDKKLEDLANEIAEKNYKKRGN